MILVAAAVCRKVIQYLYIVVMKQELAAAHQQLGGSLTLNSGESESLLSSS